MGLPWFSQQHEALPMWQKVDALADVVLESVSRLPHNHPWWLVKSLVWPPFRTFLGFDRLIAYLLCCWWTSWSFKVRFSWICERSVLTGSDGFRKEQAVHLLRKNAMGRLCLMEPNTAVWFKALLQEHGVEVRQVAQHSMVKGLPGAPPWIEWWCWSNVDMTLVAGHCKKNPTASSMMSGWCWYRSKWCGYECNRFQKNNLEWHSCDSCGLVST